MTCVEQLAEFVVGASYERLSELAREQLKVRILDALGCALGALEGEPVRMVRRYVEEFAGAGRCTLISGGRAGPDRAALYNGALVRYLDFNDSYLAKGETCHPSDNLAPVLAACEYANTSGRDLLAALAVAYQVQCRLCDVAPVRDKGFDHTTQGAYAVAAGVSRALDLDREHTANALAISGSAFNALRVTRTGRLSHWKGLAYPCTAAGATLATFLAMRGITGPHEVFEGEKGFMDAISGMFTLEWAQEDLERVTRTMVKKYNAEVHSQVAIEDLIALQRQKPFTAAEIERVDVEIFDVAYNIIGGGEEGDKTEVNAKEQADHSLPYILAVALLDGQVMPEQYRPERIRRPDVQQLLRRISIRPSEAYSRRFPEKMPCRIAVTLCDGRVLSRETCDYSSFRRLSWEAAVQKFESLATPLIGAPLQHEIEEAVANLEIIKVRDLTRLLGKARSAKPIVQEEAHIAAGGHRHA